MNTLHDSSIRIILDHQDPSGAYIASPNFGSYRYCWFRDGSFIAYAMDLVEHHDSSAQFHQWAASAVNRHADAVGRAVAKARHGSKLDAADILHTRYTLNGHVAGEEWPNFQLDGFGTWLWALGEHISTSGASAPADWMRAANLVADYLIALWDRPCYDCWEEFPDKVHPHTLAAIYAGLKAHTDFSGRDHSVTLKQVLGYLRDRAIIQGHLVKYIGSEDVDASLLALAVPYGVFEPDDPVMLATIRKIETELVQGGGLHRYAADTYYGGGEWVLLTAWLGWYYSQIEEYSKARRALQWVEDQADRHEALPEQVAVNLNDPSYFEPWRKRWGESAKPLLWSHARYIILVYHLDRHMSGQCQ